MNSRIPDSVYIYNTIHELPITESLCHTLRHYALITERARKVVHPQTQTGRNSVRKQFITQINSHTPTKMIRN